MSEAILNEAAAVEQDARRRDAGWAALLFVFAPEAATIAVMATLAAARQGPAPAMVAWLVYAAACWIDVALLWRWARRRGIEREIFDFRRPSARDLAAAAGALTVAFLLYPPIMALSARFGFSIQGMRFDSHNPAVVAAVAAWAVVTTPFCEEVLFRGLAVRSLRARGAALWLVWLLPTLAFAAIHLTYFGVAGMVYIVVWGGVLTALRLWRGHLTPGWLFHAVNNAIVYLVIPSLQ